MQTMGAGTGPWPASGAQHYHKKDCGCHGRQEDAPISGDPAVPTFETAQAASTALPASIQNSEEQTGETSKQVKAKVSRQGKSKMKAVGKKGRDAVKKPKRNNPWIKR